MSLLDIVTIAFKENKIIIKVIVKQKLLMIIIVYGSKKCVAREGCM